MTLYAYIANSKSESHQTAQEEIESYLNKAKLSIDEIISEDQTSVHWLKRQVAELFETQLKAGDSIVAYEAADLAPSTIQIIDILRLAADRKVNVHFVKYDMVFEAKNTNRTRDLIRLLHSIDNDFIARRTTEALARRRAAGLSLGRPKGRKNKSLKLDQHKKDILKYLDLQISKASIAKLIGCHPQTLYDWIDRREVADKKARKARKTTSRKTTVLDTETV
jgi:DNA invertase Pin-like site-specific DNA recombinase